MFTGRTEELAFLEVQKAALPYLHRVAYEGGAGANLEEPKDRWRQTHHKKGGKVWQLGRQRDMFVFRPLLYSKVSVKSGPLTPSGEMKNSYAVAQHISTPFPGETQVTIAYERGEETTLIEEDCGTVGMSITSFIEGQAGGGEASGGSYVKAGVSTTLWGEYAKRLEKGKNQSELISVANQVTIPAGVTGLIQQLIQTGPAKVKLTRRSVVDLGWDYVDYAKLYRRKIPFLHGNQDYRKWNGKSRIVWSCEDMGEWELLMAGQHSDYPRARNMLSNRAIREAHDYLSNEDNRTIEVTSVCTFEKSVYGDLTFTAMR